VALWHERDISHSSVERIIIPDSCILLDFMIAEFTKIIENLGDPKFKGMEKWQYTETSTAGKTSTVHYVRDPKTGSLTDFKFTKHAE